MNMKPPEILGLLEEASGTKLYERKKEAAVRTLEKKAAKLAEVDQVGALVWWWCVCGGWVGGCVWVWVWVWVCGWVGGGGGGAV